MDGLLLVGLCVDGWVESKGVILHNRFQILYYATENETVAKK